MKASIIPSGISDPSDKRIDGLAHDSITRDLDGYEYPFYYWTKLIFKKSKNHIYGCLIYSELLLKFSLGRVSQNSPTVKKF